MLAATATKEGPERRAYRVPEVARMTGLCQAMVYQIVASGRLKAVRVGKAILIPAAAVDELLADDGR
jgi:excisionase family DNA binding protein